MNNTISFPIFVVNNRNMKQLLITFVLASLFVSCGTLSKSTTDKSIFTVAESKRITSGSVDTPMRVFLITNPKDSILLFKKLRFYSNDNGVEAFYRKIVSNCKR